MSSKFQRQAFVSLALFILFFAVQLKAANPTAEVREFYNGARQMAMGGAAIAVVNDETALYLNPAGLGKLRDFFGTILDPELDASASIGSLYRSGSLLQPFQPDQVQPVLDSARETYYHARFSLSPSFVVQNFGIGLLYYNSLDAYLDAAGTTMWTKYRDDIALTLGYNLRLWDGRIKFGFSGRAISRIEIDKALTVPGDLSVKGNASEGAALAADAGLILAAPITWIPTLAVVVRDIGGTKFESGSGLRMSSTTRPSKVEQDIDVAVAVFPIHARGSRSSFTLEHKSLKAAQDASDKSRFYHVGYEWNLGDLFFLRAGMNQRYWTAGIELASETTQFQLSSYGEDVGLDGTPVEDRRTMIKFSYRF